MQADSHILIARTDNIGDVVLTLPLAGYLKSRFPGVRISFLCRSYVAPLVRHCRFIDQVVAVDALGDPTGWMAQQAIDTVIFAYPDRRLAKAAQRAGVRERVGTSHRLYHWFTCNRLAHFSRVRSPLHEAQLNFALLRPLGMPITPTLDQLPAWYGVDAPRTAQVDTMFAVAPFNVILHPKSNGNGREWPLARYTELAQCLGARADVRVWITGSAAEGALIARDAPELLALPNVSNACGLVDLDGLCAMIGACDALVASGTGPLHVAAAMGRPTLGLFPPKKPIDPARWGALGARARSLTAPQACVRCTDPVQCACMRAIGAAEVADIVTSWCADAGPTNAKDNHGK